MSREKRGLFGRLRQLLTGMFAVWIKEGEEGNPAAVYEGAINERRKQYRELKEAVAGILYMRNKLEAEITERRAEVGIADPHKRGMDIVYRVTNVETGREVARGKTGIVFFNYDAGKMVSMPAPFKKAFNLEV